MANFNCPKITLSLLLLLVLSLAVFKAHTQHKDKPILYKGFETTFGQHSLISSSNFPELDQLKIGLFGGSVGMQLRKGIWSATLRVAGLYYATSNTGRTIDLFESGIKGNVFPFETMVRSRLKRLKPFVTAGLTSQFSRFYGYYCNKSDMFINYSDTREPYIGKKSALLLTAGVGMEYQIVKNDDGFVNVFVETMRSIPLGFTDDDSLFEQTSFGRNHVISIGINYGFFGK